MQLKDAALPRDHGDLAWPAIAEAGPAGGARSGSGREGSRYRIDESLEIKDPRITGL